MAALLFGVAAVAVFLAHEPGMVACGYRGKRTRAGAGARARRRFILLIAIGMAAAVAGTLLDPAAARGALVPGALVGAFGYFMVRRRERTLPAEILASSALAAAALPVALASGWGIRAAVAAFAGWSTGFAAITPVIWSLAHKRRTSPVACGLNVTLPLLATAAGAALLGQQVVVTSAALILTTTAIVAVDPGARALRTIGWGVAAASAVSAIGLIAVTAHG